MSSWPLHMQASFYPNEPKPSTPPSRLYRHVLGATELDTLLYEERDERFRLDVERTRSGAFLLLTIASHTTSEVRFLAAAQPNADFRLIAPREDNHEYYADHHPGLSGDRSGGVFYIRTNSA